MKLTEEEQELIKKLRAEKAKELPIKALDSYFASEKIAAFERLYAMALDNLNHAQAHGGEKKDFEHWCFEAVMDLLGPNVWKVYNGFVR